MIKRFNLFFVTFFYSGKIKFAPGTFASLITCVLFFFLSNIFSITIFFIATLLIFFYSIIAINNISDKFTSKDPHEIVIDEVVGQMIPLLAIPIYETLYPTLILFYCIASFLLFRIFDIFKPFPINYIDQNITGALGIMLDDIMAGIYVVILLNFLFFFIGA